MTGLNWSDENKNETPWTWTIEVDSALKESDWKREVCQRIDKKIPHLRAFKHRLGLYNNKQSMKITMGGKAKYSLEHKERKHFPFLPPKNC